VKPKTECKQCGECCKIYVVKGIVKTKDAIEYATAHGFTFDGDAMLVPSPCPHLASDGKCGIYETRPQICRDYTGRSRRFYTPIGCVYRK
jgi:Fe-S-cluster containining protein